MGQPKVTIKQKVEVLRGLMKKNQLNAYIVPSEDAHQSEYICKRDKRREYISGFTGSSGCAVITESHELLWTDGRYWLQAEQQLDQSWKIMKDRVAGEPTIEEWLAKNLTKEMNVGVDSRLVSKGSCEKMGSVLKKSGIRFLPSLEENLIDQVRVHFKDQEEIPSYPENPVFYLDEKFTGKESAEKLKSVREEMVAEGVDFMVVSALDEIAWLFNLRGSDISFNPVFLSYVIVSRDQGQTLYVDEKKLSADVRSKLTPNTHVASYGSVFSDLSKYNAEGKKIWLDPRSSNALFSCVSKENLKEKTIPILLMKSIKNQVEIEGFRQSHIRDASALIQYLAWLENEILVVGNTSLTEVTAADHLEQLRSKQKDYVSLSFDSISSMDSNGAIIHYKPEPETCKKITKGMYLIDSGGQYLDGTTDVTRTLHYGVPTQHEIDCYTRVLKGHLQLSLLKFPPRIHGRDIDCIARSALWRVGLDYGHGTGHGVGSFLNVHEGPQGISFRSVPNPTLFQAGMTVTNEPGYYEAGKFGIRIENVMITVPVQTQFNNGSYLGFESVTLVPFESKLINLHFLDNEEIKFINQYYQEIRQKILPTLTHDQLATKWLERNTEPLKLHNL
eukprot:gene1474-1859_t